MARLYYFSPDRKSPVTFYKGTYVSWGWTQRMSSLQGSPQPLAFQYSGLGPAPKPPLEVTVLGHYPFYRHLPSFCWLSRSLC